MSENEIKAKIKELRELQAMQEELTAEITTIQDDLKALMGDTKEMRAGEYKLRFKTIISNRFDSSAFKATHSELYNQYIKQTITRRFSVA